MACIKRIARLPSGDETGDEVSPRKNALNEGGVAGCCQPAPLPNYYSEHHYVYHYDTLYVPRISLNNSITKNIFTGN